MMMPGFPKPLARSSGVAFRSVTSSSVNLADQTLAAPAGQKAGDLLLVVYATAAARPADTPTGWTLVRSFSDSGSAFFAFSKIATADGETVRINTPLGTGARTIIYACFSGASGLDAGAINNTSASATIVLPAVTATGKGIRLATAFIDSTSATVTSPPVGFTEIVLSVGTTVRLGLWMLPDQPAGASPTASVTFSDSALLKAGFQMQAR
jgi:hypothetical protein